MMLLCLSASRIYDTFSISTRSRKKKLGNCSTVYTFCSPRQKSWHDVIMPERFQDTASSRRLSEKMCTRQSRKVIWDLIYTLFLTLQLLNLLLLLSFICIRKHSSTASCAILSNFFEELRTQNRPQYLSGLSRTLFSTTFLEIGLHNKFRISIRSRKKKKKQGVVLYLFWFTQVEVLA